MLSWPSALAGKVKGNKPHKSFIKMQAALFLLMSAGSGELRT